MNFPEPRSIEAESIAELGLRENVPVPLTLRVAVRARQLVEKPKRIRSSPTEVVVSRPFSAE